MAREEYQLWETDLALEAEKLAMVEVHLRHSLYCTVHHHIILDPDSNDIAVDQDHTN